MKSYKDFVSSQVVKSEPEVVIEQSQEPEILELEDLPNLLGEALENRHEPMDPPNILVMRRVSVRQYPNNQRVALYYVDKVHKYVTVPYTAMQWSAGVTESVEKNIIEQLTDASVSMDATEVFFKNNTSLFVNESVAKQMLKLYNSLSEENKKSMIEVAGSSKNQFLEIKRNFAN